MKSLTSKINADLQRGSGMPSGSIKASKQFFRSWAWHYQLSPRNGLFAAYTENMWAFQGTRAPPRSRPRTWGFNAIKEQTQARDLDHDGWLAPHEQLAANVLDGLTWCGLTTGCWACSRHRHQGNRWILSNVGSVDSAGVEGACLGGSLRA